MIQQFVNNGRLVALTIAVILVAGMGGLSTLPRAEDPRITGRLAIVNTPFPGASAERVEALVTEPLENKLRELSEIRRISSTSSAGMSVITIELIDAVGEREKPVVWSRARDLLQEARQKLPQGAQVPKLDDNRGFAYTLLYSLVWKGVSEPQISILGRYAKELESRLRGVSGTELVGVYGEPEEEILVEANSAKLASLGLSAAVLSNAVGQADAKVAAGQLQNKYNRMAVEVSGELSDMERIRRIPLLTSDGLNVRLGDVASVQRQEKTPAASIALVDGGRSVVVGVRMLPDRRVDYWTQEVETAVDEFKLLLPANVEVKALFNQNEYTQNRLGELFVNISMGFAIILVVLFFTLGLRSALIVAAALPLTVMFTLAVMKYYGLPIHQMSITGLIVALGIMVDNAIVMVDSIARERNRGATPVDAVLRSVKHLWMPLLGSTLTTILAFFPIVLMPGAAGEFVGGIALSVIFSLIGSYLISHTVIAGLAGRYLRVENSGGKRARWWQNGLKSPQLAEWFKNSLYWALRYPRRTVLAVMLLPALGFFAASQLTEQFFPASDRDMFHVEVYLPSHASIDATRVISRKVSGVLAEQADIISQQWFVGASAPSFYYNLMENRDGSANYAQAMITAKDFKAANRLIPLLQISLDEAFPRAQILVRKLEQGPPVTAPIEFRLYGPNLTVLKELGDEVRRVMLETPDVIHARATLSGAVPKIWFNVDEELSRQSGLALRDLSAQLQNSIDGVVQGSVLESTQSLPIRIRFKASDRNSLEALEGLNFVPPDTRDQRFDSGKEFSGIPLSAIGSLNLKPVRGAIPRRNGQRLNTIEGYMRDGVLPASVAEAVSVRLNAAGFSVPPGYRLELGGEGAERNSAVSKLMSSVGVILVLLVLVVVLSFNSFRLSGIIFAVAIQAAGLGLLSVFVFGHPFGFTVIIGLLGLVGLAINAAIVILAELKANNEAVDGGVDQIVAAVVQCSRHISSTTITTVGGFLPLIVAGGGFWPPFAIAIAGGTVLTTLVSFYFVPSAFLLFAQKKAFEAGGDAMTDIDDGYLQRQ